MNSLSAKNKIYIAVMAWLILCAGMFGFFFKILNRSNADSIAAISAKQAQLQQLLAQQESFKKAQSDLDQMAAKQDQPDSFFSKDITLVKEIETLENLSASLHLKFQLSGVSGTVKSAPKAKTATDIVTIPASITVVGTYNEVVAFVETLEKLNFITNVSGITVTTAGADVIAGNLSANFYLKK